MILEAGVWRGSGSWRSVRESTLVRFDGEFIVSDERDGKVAVDIETTTTTGLRHEYGVWIARNETGLYDVNVMGTAADLMGTAKLESLPHLALLSDNTGSVQLTATLFRMPEVFGFRGFVRKDTEMFTFEVAIRPRFEEVTADNVIQFRPRGI